MTWRVKWIAADREWAECLSQICVVCMCCDVTSVESSSWHPGLLGFERDLWASRHRTWPKKLVLSCWGRLGRRSNRPRTGVRTVWTVWILSRNLSEGNLIVFSHWFVIGTVQIATCLSIFTWPCALSQTISVGNRSSLSDRIPEAVRAIERAGGAVRAIECCPFPEFFEKHPLQSLGQWIEGLATGAFRRETPPCEGTAWGSSRGCNGKVMQCM